MNDSHIKVFRQKAQDIADELAVPLFYADKAAELERADVIASDSRPILHARAIMKLRGGVLGHGYGHAHRVALEAGAIVYSEYGINPRADRLVRNILIAGYLHDIKRDEKDHPERAAFYAREEFGALLEANDLEMITFAIKNHEAFREQEFVEDADFMLMADSLYDADKFRWGPDNFLFTIWDMAESMNFAPRAVFDHYDKGVRGIIKIKGTFRTPTGKKYGPDFIDSGLRIGEELLRYYRQNFS